MWSAGDAAGLDIDFFVGPSWGDTCQDFLGIAGSDCATNFNRDAIITDTIGKIENAATPDVTIPEVCFWGLGCTPSYTIEGIDFGDYGAEVTGSTAGQIGFDLAIDATAGDVDVAYGGNVEFEWAERGDIVAGEPLTISTAFAEGATALSTNFPEASMTLDFVFDLLVAGKFEACIVDCATLPFGPSTSLVDQGGIDVEARIPLIDIDSNELEIEFNLPFTTVVAQLPDLNTSTTSTDAAGNLMTSGTGLNPLFDVDIDLDLIATTLLGLPPLGADVGILGSTAYYNLLQVLIGADVDIRQVFTFDPNLMVTLDADDGQSINGAVGDDLTFASIGNGATVVTPTFQLLNSFRNTTYLDITPTFLLALMEAGLILDLPGFVNDLGIDDVNLILGPLFEFEPEFDVLASIPIFNEDWQIAFAPVTTNSFIIEVPEPGTLTLFGIGLLALGASRRRRRNIVRGK